MAHLCATCPQRRSSDPDGPPISASGTCAPLRLRRRGAAAGSAAAATVLSRPRRTGGFAPELAVRHAIDQSFPGMPAQAAQQAAGGIRIAGINHQDVRLVGQGQPDHQRKVGAAIQPADVPPRDGVVPDLDVAFVNFNRRDAKPDRGPGRRSPETGRSRSNRAARSAQTRRKSRSSASAAKPAQKIVAGHSITRDWRWHTFRLPCRTRPSMRL